uniref:Sec1 family domain-containing protein MIP3 n=1 Tax=Kalanchoe fedtschenkoi TaxID=63787 RepID=A0A7N0TYM8_KALFE
MASVDVIKTCLDSIRQISEHIEGAVVYLDAGCTESFQFLGAFSLLVELGAVSVCSLENPGSLDEVSALNAIFSPVKKLAVITSRLLSDVHRYILRCLNAHHGVSKCIILTSISEIAHSTYPDSPLGPDAFHEYESLLVQDYEELVKKTETTSSPSVASPGHSGLGDVGWSKLSSNEEDSRLFETHSSLRESRENSPRFRAQKQSQSLTVAVHLFPMIVCPFSSSFFVLPSEGLVAESYLSLKHDDSLSSGLPPLSTGLPYDSDDIPPGVNLTAHFLYHLASKMDLKMEIYSFGDQSKVVGKMLTDMSSLYDVGRRKRSAGLLLIDRTLDLLTPCCHADSLVDRMFSSLTRRDKCTSYAHLKVSPAQTQLPYCLKRAPLDVQIPVAEILNENATTDIHRLLESIEAFLHGWDPLNPESQKVDLAALSAEIHDGKARISEKELFTGSFISTENFRGTPYLEALLDRRTKDGAILVKKWLQETLRQETISVNVKVRPGVAKRSELLPLVKALASNQTSLLKNRGIIQLAAAILFVLDDTHGSQWDAFISAEKMLNVSAGDTSQSLAAQMVDIINKSSLVGSSRHKDGNVKQPQGLLFFEDALLLTITGYILAGENFPTASSDGPFSWQEENFLKEAIMEAVLDNPSAARLKFLQGLSEELETNFRKMKGDDTKVEFPKELELDDLDDDAWGKWGDEDEEISDSKDQVYDDMQLKLELRDRVDNLFKFLRKLSSLRRKNIPTREAALGFDTTFSDDPNFSKGLVYKLLTRVLGKHDVPGLEYHSSTVGRLFKSGFGRFGLGQAKPSLADQTIILVFVIGGINSVEVREAREALSESGRPNTEMIIGGTTLLTPNDMLELLLGEYGYV